MVCLYWNLPQNIVHVRICFIYTPEPLPSSTSGKSPGTLLSIVGEGQVKMQRGKRLAKRSPNSLVEVLMDKCDQMLPDSS